LIILFYNTTRVNDQYTNNVLNTIQYIRKIITRKKCLDSPNIWGDLVIHFDHSQSRKLRVKRGHDDASYEQGH